jgi:transposase
VRAVLVRRYELTDPRCALIGDLLPSNGRRGARWNDHRTTLDGLFWLLRTGARWRQVPERYGKWKSVHDRFRRWRKDGAIDRILERLHSRLDPRGRIDHDLRCIDAASIRASRPAAGALRRLPAGEPADHALGRSRGGFGTKRHPVVDGHGVPLSASVTPGQAHESRPVEPVLEAVRLAPPGRGQGSQRPAGATRPAAAWDRAGDPGPQGPEAEPAVRWGDLSAARRGGAVREPAEGEPSAGDAAREAGGPLRGHGPVGHDPPLLEAPGVTRQALAPMSVR